MKTMTAAEYLVARGWTETSEAWRKQNGITRVEWFDPKPRGLDENGELLSLCEGDAIIIQQARDEEKAREAWVRFAAGASSAAGQNGDGSWDVLYSTDGLAQHADAMLRLYRDRFAVQIVEAPAPAAE